jgi:hypothetical protein
MIAELDLQSLFRFIMSQITVSLQLALSTTQLQFLAIAADKWRPEIAAWVTYAKHPYSLDAPALNAQNAGFH